MTMYKARLRDFEDLLQAEEIDLENLRKLAFNGIPDEKGLRPFCWRLLLNYLPPDKKLHDNTLYRNRQLYKQFIDEILVLPSGETDHPLNLDPDSTWGAFFKDNEVLLQIDKDVRRLCPDISFFQLATQFPCERIVNGGGLKRLHKRVENSTLRYANVVRKGVGATKLISDKKCLKDRDTESYLALPEGCEAHWEVVERMLFLYAKLNPGQGYVQGMNEIIGPIYHTFASDPNASFKAHAEADCFFCFTNLMGEIRDFFISSLDETDGGINQTMNRLTESLKMNDPDIYDRLEVQNLKPQYYGFRWLTLLLSQEFPLPDVERIWDSLFADQHRFKFLIHVCCAMIILLKEQLMEGDFATNVKLLQNFPPMDVSVIIMKAVELSQVHTK